jgi:hypothetical protein
MAWIAALDGRVDIIIIIIIGKKNDLMLLVVLFVRLSRFLRENKNPCFYVKRSEQHLPHLPLLFPVVLRTSRQALTKC